MGRVAVVGCADVAPPHGAEVSREGDMMIVRCNSSGDTWFLSCSGSQWTYASGIELSVSWSDLGRVRGHG